MNIIINGLSMDSEKDIIFLIFKSDTELNDLLAKLAATEVRASGARILSIIPKGRTLNPLQKSVLDVLESLDGVCGNSESAHNDIVENAINSITKIIEDYSI